MPSEPSTVQSEPKPPDIKPTVAFYTLGCKTNQLETSTIAGEFRIQGWEVVPFEAGASVYVVNTCTVTEKADQESRRIIRRAKLSNPKARIAVTGCFAQVAPEELAREDGVNYVIGNNFKDQIVRILSDIPVQERPYVQVSEIDKSRIVEGASSSAIGRTRGSLKIQDGCGYKCTYCIIWEARGQSRSLPVVDLKHQLQGMLAEGFREVVLTGINIGQYDDQGRDLADLLRELCSVPGDFRLRLSSLDPLEVTDKLIDTVCEFGTALDGKICPHFHLSAQSAEDVVLKRMARRHHVDEFIRVCETIARKIPDASIGSDIIVGFPGETDERFESTCQVLESVPMNYFHVFSYSRRKGTPAADFPDQVSTRVKKARAKRLMALSEVKSLTFRKRFIGREFQVIVEESLAKGMSENYLKIHLEPTETPLCMNDRVDVTVTRVTAEETWGQVRKIHPAFSIMVG